MTTRVGCNNCGWTEKVNGNPVQSNAEAKQYQIDHTCENPDTYRRDVPKP